MINPINEIVKKLGALPKKKRKRILTLLNLPIYVQFFLYLFNIELIVISKYFMVLLCVLCLLIDLKILSYGGWWWANDDDEYVIFYALFLGFLRSEISISFSSFSSFFFFASKCKM